MIACEAIDNLMAAYDLSAKFSLQNDWNLSLFLK